MKSIKNQADWYLIANEGDKIYVPSLHWITYGINGKYTQPIKTIKSEMIEVSDSYFGNPPRGQSKEIDSTTKNLLCYGTWEHICIED